MSTHALGTGTANLSINVPVDERNLWGRLAFLAIQRGEAKSAGDYERQVLARGLETVDPEAAVRLREIRSRYYAGALAVLVLLGAVCQWLGFSDEDPARRSSPTVRVKIVQRGVRGEGESENFNIA